MTRISWDEYFMEMAKLASRRSSCIRRQVGAVLVKDNHIISTGYNGSPKGTEHCIDIGCIREKNHIPSGERHELCRGTHAEQNCIAQAAKNGVSTNDTVMYTKVFPCTMCLKIMINAGIKEIVYEEDYNDSLSEQLIKESKIIVRKLKKADV